MAPQIALNGSNSNSRLVNLGTITAACSATVIEMGGNDHVQNTGTLTGTIGIKMGQLAHDGPNNAVCTSGTIATSSTTITVMSGFSFIENSGTLRSDLSHDVQIAGDCNRLNLGYVPTTQTLINSGQITSIFYAAVPLLPGSRDSVFERTNTGTINPPNGPVTSFGSSTDIIINHGTMTGFIDLSFGDDVFDGRCGTVKGDIYSGLCMDKINLRGATVNRTVYGGEGADVCFVSDATLTLIQQGGDIDLVNATPSYRLVTPLKTLPCWGGGHTNGGLGRDIMFGNGGADSFVFITLSHIGANTATADTIADFVRGDDVIDLRSIDANTNNAGPNDTVTFIGVAAFSAVAGQTRVAQSAGNTYVGLDVNGDPVSDAMIRLTRVYTLNANDFALQRDPFQGARSGCRGPRLLVVQ